METRVDGGRARRNTKIAEIGDYNPENDTVETSDLYSWDAHTDEYTKNSGSASLNRIKNMQGWSDETLQMELEKRKVVLAYLSTNGINSYSDVAAVIQAFIQNEADILEYISNGEVRDHLDDLRQLGNVDVEGKSKAEETITRPDPDTETLAEMESVLEESDIMEGA